MNKWLPIETAPKDGNEFLGAIGLWCVIVHWHDLESRWQVFGFKELRHCEPEYWMPLPDTPEILEGETK